VQFHFRSAKFFLRAFCGAVASDFCLLLCYKHMRNFSFTFLLINFLLYSYNIWVEPLFLNLECFAWKCHHRTDVNRKPQRWLHVDEEISKSWQYNISSVRLGIEVSKMWSLTQTEISIALSSPANFKELCVRGFFWPLRNSLTSLAIKLCGPMNLHPWTVLPTLRNSDHSLDITQTNDGIEATKLQPLSQEPHGAADGEQGGL